MTIIPWKKGGILSVFLAVAIFTGCGGNIETNTKRTEKAPQTELTAIPIGVVQIKLNLPDNVSNAKGFKIERTADPKQGSWAEIASVDADITSYIDSLKDVPIDERHDRIFYYRLHTDGGAKDGEYSNVAAARLPPQGMAAIPAGCFDMGDSFDEGGIDEVPVHKVCLKAFYIDVHEVTNSEFEKCIGGRGCTWISGNGNGNDYYGIPRYGYYPVITIFWEEAKSYCAWAGKRLPTEEEWEYAARGGLAGKRYPRGDTMSCSDANYGRYVSPCRDFGGLENREQQVGSYPANGYGLHDMDGNVREWVADWYSATYYSRRPDPDNDSSGSGIDDLKFTDYHVVRGGGWRSVSPLLLRVSFRDIDTNFTHQEIGFRCAADPVPIESP